MHRQTLTSGLDAVRQYDAVKQFDWNGWRAWHGVTGDMAPPQGRGQAMDAAGSSGFMFLAAQLESLDPRLVEPLQAVYHERDMPIKTGGGYPQFTSAWASNYASAGGGFLGLSGTNTNDVPIAQADVQKGTWPVFPWNQGFFISYVDLQRAQTAKAMGMPMPFSLQDIYEKSTRTTWKKMLEQVTYLGYFSNPGLVNNPAVSAAVVAKGASGSTVWSSKTFTEILNDINFGVTQAVTASGFDLNGCPDTLLLPFTQFNLLTQPATIGGVGYDSALSYIKKNCAAAAYFGGDPNRFNIDPLPNPFISGQGIGNTAAQNAQGNGLDRAVFYRRDKECLHLPIPTVMQPSMTIPSEKVGYTTFFSGAVGVVNVYRPQTIAYADGI